MKKLLILLLFPLFLFGLDKAYLMEKLSKDIDCHYQDILINGETIHEGWMCPQRYEVVKPILELYERPIKILDVGANNGYFSIRAASEYDATCVMVDRTLRLKRICEYNSEVPNLMYLKKSISTQDLKRLKETEHFDVIFVFNVLHHISGTDSWKTFLNELIELGDNLIIETPPVYDVKYTENPEVADIHHHLFNLPHAKQIGSFPRFKYDGTFPAVDESRPDLMIWLSNRPKDLFPDVYKEPIETGMNLMTFNALHGRYPTKKQVKEEMSSLPLLKRLFSNKVIVQGTVLK